MTIASTPTPHVAEFLPSDGMPIMQVISMLMAAQAQGATAVRVAQQQAGHGVASGIDWISEKPIDCVVYLGCMPTWDDMSNEALNSLDW